MRRKLIYIVNPISGTSSKDSIQNTIASQTLKEGLRFRFFPSVADGNYAYLEDIILTEKFTDVIIVGGDGTIGPVIDSLKHLPVCFGIIPCGSGNGLAFGAGISRNIKRALHTIFNGEVILTDGFRVNGQFACMLCGLGFDAKVAHEFAKLPQRGLPNYIRLSVQHFFDAKPYLFKIKLAEKSFQVEAYFISIANSNQFGNNFTIAPKARLNDGLLDIVIVTEQSKTELLYNTLIQLSGLNPLKTRTEIHNKRGIIYFQTQEIKITNAGEALIHIDGDPVTTKVKLHAVIEEKCFKLLINKNPDGRTDILKKQLSAGIA